MTQQEYYKAQQRVGQVGSTVAGGAALLGQYSNIINAPTPNTIAPSQQLDSYGRPTYNLGQFASDVQSFKPPKTSGGEIAAAAGTGAAAGAAFGPYGAAAGAVIGAGGALIGGGIRRRKAERKNNLARRNLFAAQQLYNKGIEGFNMTDIARSQYDAAQNTQGRINNLYTYNNQY